MMWTCKIDHSTIYEYEHEVSLDPHVIRLSPKLNSSRRLVSSETMIDPRPAGHWSGIDAFGNDIEQIWFLGRYSHLRIQIKISLEIEAYDPFHFIIFPLEAVEQRYYQTVLLPKALLPYTSGPPANDEEAELIATCLKQGKGEVVPFLLELTRHVYRSIESEKRKWGPAKAARQTLQDGKGSCRDLTVLFIHLCRTSGIPARFISGYHIQSEYKSELHAWAEVFIFGAGWIGFDPSMGTICNWRYIPLACGIEQQDTMPVTGSYFGPGDSQLDTMVSLQLLKSP